MIPHLRQASLYTFLKQSASQNVHDTLILKEWCPILTITSLVFQTPQTLAISITLSKMICDGFPTLITGKNMDVEIPT